MKKFFLLICVFLLSGCSNEFVIKGKITEIKYNDIYIHESDFSKVKKMINKVYNKNEDKDLSNKLTIKTTFDIYYFSLNDNKIKFGDKVGDNDYLNVYLQKLTKKYTNRNSFSIDYMKNYDSNDEQTILLDKTSNYIIINFGEKVSNLRINEVEAKADRIVDIDLLYSEDSVNEKVIIRKSINYDNPDIRISFENKYNYIVSIIPVYNDEKDKVEFKTTFNVK